MSERIAVVIPLYNQGALVTRALDSVIAQTEPVDEIVVVDDGSTDDGPAAVQAVHDPRIKLIRQTNAGVSAARNAGWNATDADLVAFLDADDEHLPHFIAEIRALRAELPDCGLYATAYDRENDGRRTPFGEGEGRTRVEAAFPKLCMWSRVHASAMAVPKAMLREVGGFPEDMALGEDLELWARVLLRAPCAYSGRVSAIYHDNPASVMRSRPVQAGEPPFARAYADYLASHPGFADSGFEELIALTRLSGFLMGNWLLGRRELVRQTFAEARRFPRCRKTRFALQALTLLPKPLGFALYRWIEARRGRSVGTEIREPGRKART